MKTTFSEHSYFADKISDNPVLLDIGSCRGAFASHFLENFPTSNIICVEPSKSNFPHIKIENKIYK